MCPEPHGPKYMWKKQDRALSACDANLAAWCIVGTLATQRAVTVQQETNRPGCVHLQAAVSSS